MHPFNSFVALLAYHHDPHCGLALTGLKDRSGTTGLLRLVSALFLFGTVRKNCTRFSIKVAIIK